MSDDVLSSEFDQAFALKLVETQYPKVFAEIVDKVQKYHRDTTIRKNMPPHSPVEYALLPGMSRDINQVCWYAQLNVSCLRQVNHSAHLLVPEVDG